MAEKDIWDLLLKVPTVIFAIVGAYWSAIRFFKRDELFPRIGFEVTANFLGLQKQQIITEVAAILENKGEVPIKIKNLTFKLRGLSTNDELIRGGSEIRHQLIFAEVIEKGDFTPKTWAYTFIYPGVKTAILG